MRTSRHARASRTCRRAIVDKRTIGHAYDGSATDFAAAADRYAYRFLARPLADALGSVDGRVLDVAAGTGAAGRSFGDTVALDLSMGQLRQNASRHPVQADAEQLPFAVDTFAAAVCAFGVNHFHDARAAVSEMARVAPLVGVVTWRRPAGPYMPKQVLLDVLARHTGRTRTDTGVFLDSMGDRIGSCAAVAALLSGAGLRPEVDESTVVVPWPGIEAFLDYRLSMASTAGLVNDVARLRNDAVAALAAVPETELEWRARLVVGVGRRRTRSRTTPGGDRPNDAD